MRAALIVGVVCVAGSVGAIAAQFVPTRRTSGEGVMSADTKGAVERVMVGADVLRVLWESPWLDTRARAARVLSGAVTPVAAYTVVSAQPQAVEARQWGRVLRLQSALARDLFSPRVAEDQIRVLAGVAKSYRGHRFWGWTGGVYRKVFQAVAVSGTSAGARAQIFLYTSSPQEMQTQPGEVRVVTRRMRLDEFATFRRVGNRWYEASDTEYTHDLGVSRTAVEVR